MGNTVYFNTCFNGSGLSDDVAVPQALGQRPRDDLAAFDGGMPGIGEIPAAFTVHPGESGVKVDEIGVLFHGQPADRGIVDIVESREAA